MDLRLVVVNAQHNVAIISVGAKYLLLLVLVLFLLVVLLFA